MSSSSSTSRIALAAPQFFTISSCSRQPKHPLQTNSTSNVPEHCLSLRETLSKAIQGTNSNRQLLQTIQGTDLNNFISHNFFSLPPRQKCQWGYYNISENSSKQFKAHVLTNSLATQACFPHLGTKLIAWTLIWYLSLFCSSNQGKAKQTSRMKRRTIIGGTA
jgi:hypothetical protein